MKKTKSVAAFMVAVSVGLVGCSSGGGSYESISPEDARTELSALYGKINPSVEPLSKDIAGATLSAQEELPDLNTSYPYTVDGTGQIDLEIFASPEKAGAGRDGILNEIAQDFNRQNVQVNGQSVSVSVRSIPSGVAVDYISSKTATPDAYSPSNYQWDDILEAKGVRTDDVAPRLFGNTSGVLMSDATYQEFGGDSADISSVVRAVESGKLLGYTNPYSSSTGMSLLTQLLYHFDAANPVSDSARSQFQAFQSKVPSTFFTTAQLRDAARDGSADIMAMSYQMYVNTPEFSSYKYIPMGVRQDSPVYSLTQDAGKKEALQKFVDFVLNEQNQQKATEFGFNQLDDYSFTDQTRDGNTLISMQNLWKKNKNAGKPIVGVFVADVSGSMDGEPLNELKKSLLNSLQYIDSANSVGLVSYNDRVAIDVPVAPMDGTQKAYFNAAIKDMSSGGGTATYDATIVALQMLEEQMDANPDARPVIFVLSDGETTDGHSFERVAPIIEALGVTVHTIGYNADLEELGRLAQINESAVIDASSDDVAHKLKELFNAEF